MHIGNFISGDHGSLSYPPGIHCAEMLCERSKGVIFRVLTAKYSTGVALRLSGSTAVNMMDQLLIIAMKLDTLKILFNGIKLLRI